MLSVKIAEYSVRKQWISSEDKLWCIYALEKKLMTAVFLLSLIPFALFFHSFEQMAIYSCLLLLLRRRFGGWHAPSAGLCLLLSVAQVLLITVVIGPKLSELSLRSLLVFDAITMLTAIIVKPVYPKQVHFDQAIVKENNRRKNFLLLGIAMLQLILGIWYKDYLIYSLLASLTSVLSVAIEYVKQSASC